MLFARACLVARGLIFKEIKFEIEMNSYLVSWCALIRVELDLINVSSKF